MTLTAALIFDIALVALVGTWLTDSILRGYRALMNPTLWFVAGSALFLNVGAIRDSLLGMKYDPFLEATFRSMEVLQLGLFGLSAMVGSKIFRENSSRLRGLRIAVPRFVGFLIVAFLLKVSAANPFEEFNQEHSNYFRLLGGLSTAGAALTVAFYEQRVRNLSSVPALIVSLLLAGAFAAESFSASRTPLMYSLFVLLLYVVFRVQQLPNRLPRALVASAMPIVLVLLTVVGSVIKVMPGWVRHDGSIQEMLEAAGDHGGTLKFIDAYENGMIALDTYPGQQPFRYGESLSSIVLAPIPRAMWADKPFAFAYHFTAEKHGIYYYSETGTSLATSLIGDVWAGGGVFNIVLLSIAIGMASGWMRAWQLRHSDLILVQVIYWQFLFMTALSQRGDMYTIYVRGLVFLAFTYLSARIVSRRFVMGE